MSDAKYTKGLWTVGYDYGYTIVGAWGSIYIGSIEDEADAARIVAVINAMAGIDDPADFVKRALAAGVHK